MDWKIAVGTLVVYKWNYGHRFCGIYMYVYYFIQDITGEPSHKYLYINKCYKHALTELVLLYNKRYTMPVLKCDITQCKMK